MRTVLTLVAVLALAACDREAATPAEPAAPPGPAAPAGPTAPVEPAPIPSKPPLVAPPETGDRLAFVDAGGVERLHLACGDGSPAFRIFVPGFRPIASEDRLTVGAGDEAFAHAADLEASGPGVTAGGDIDADLIARIERGEPVRAVYGARSAGPLTAADPAALRAFVERCRAAAGG